MREPGNLKLFKKGPSAEVRFGILLVLCLVMIFTDAHSPVLNPLRQTLSVGIYPFERVVLAPRDALEYVDSWSNAANIARTEREALRRQRIEMAQLSTHAAQLSAENEQLRRLLNVTQSISQDAIAVEVLYVPNNTFNHRLIFDKGSQNGIRAGMPVIDEGGVVGQIIRTTPFTSEAAMVIDGSVSIPVQILRNGLRLIAFGSNDIGKLEVRYLSANADILVGDTLVTSGIGGYFPAGLPVGKIESVDRDPGSGFALALAQPMSHPERYRHFLVLHTEDADLSDITGLDNGFAQE